MTRTSSAPAVDLPEVLSAIEQAGVSLLKPADGFKILDGLPLDVQGGVLDREKLANLAATEPMCWAN